MTTLLRTYNAAIKEVSEQSNKSVSELAERRRRWANANKFTSNGTRASRSCSIIDRSTATATFQQAKASSDMGRPSANSLQGWFARARSHRSAQQHRLQVVTEKAQVPWETRFDELVQYKAKHGDCDVPTKQGKLGTWVGTQRGAYRDDTLAQDRIDRLNSIGFKWTRMKDAARTEAGRLDSTSSSNTRQSTATATFPRRRGQLGRVGTHTA